MQNRCKEALKRFGAPPFIRQESNHNKGHGGLPPEQEQHFFP